MTAIPMTMGPISLLLSTSVLSESPYTRTLVLRRQASFGKILANSSAILSIAVPSVRLISEDIRLELPNERTGRHEVRISHLHGSGAGRAALRGGESANHGR